ncbi:hypothetical protein B8W96_03160 [Lentilactobacillus parakefiri]|uniref:hypothetical protein n=1 Tax=Lentilactobacillus parakefiri TaxID=152332 RepID=UPI000BA50E4D|nr:hypothetical protein [Lentilactobacillus parakefiri]PAL01154.1 hypothetical protein B8W96_03160 [Lentilactobacillus parakefiri]
MKRNDLKRLTGTLAAASILFTLSAAASPARAADTFSKDEISGPTGYFKSDKAQFAFHWKYLKTSKGVQTVLVFGDFNKPQLQVGMPTLNNISKDRRTFTSQYKFVSTKGKLLKQVYYFPLVKLSDTTYRVHLAYHNGARVPSANGKAYTFTKTSKSPAKSYANKYAAKSLKKQYTAELEKSVQKQYQKEKAAGKNVSNPKTNKTVQKRIRNKVNNAVKKSVKQIIKGFNYNVK